MGLEKPGKILVPIFSFKPSAPTVFLKFIFYRCKVNCGAMCVCRKARFKRSAVFLNCSGETCNNIMEKWKLIEVQVYSGAECNTEP